MRSVQQTHLAWYEVSHLAWYEVSHLAWYEVSHLAWYEVSHLAWYEVSHLAWYEVCFGATEARNSEYFYITPGEDNSVGTQARKSKKRFSAETFKGTWM